MDTFLLGLFEEFERTLMFSYHSGGVCEVPVGYTTGWRTLPFACCAQTTYTSIIHLGGERIVVRPQEACVIPQGVHHRIDVLGSVSGISRFAHVNYRILSCIDAMAIFDVPLIHHAEVAVRIGQLCAELSTVACEPTASPLQIIRKKSIGFDLLWTIASASQLRSGASADIGMIERLRPVYQYIHQELAERITLKKLARIANLSESRFHVVFKTMSGLAPQRFIQRLRMEKAQQLLIETESPVKEIAASVGHPDEFHFSRTFKQMCGASPTTYRRTARRTFSNATAKARLGSPAGLEPVDDALRGTGLSNR